MCGKWLYHERKPSILIASHTINLELNVKIEIIVSKQDAGDLSYIFEIFVKWGHKL